MQEYLEDTNDTTDADITIEYLISGLKNPKAASFPVKRIITSNKHKPGEIDVKQLLESGKIDNDWKSSGCPGPPDKLVHQRKELRYKFRSAQQINAISRERHRNSIMTASKNDTSTFYKLIKKQ